MPAPVCDEVRARGAGDLHRRRCLNIEEIVTVGTRWELHDSMASAHVFHTGRSARVDRPVASSWRVRRRRRYSPGAGSPIPRREPDRGRGPAPGEGPPFRAAHSLCRPTRSSGSKGSRARRDGDCERGRPLRAGSLAEANRGRRRRGTPPDRARSRRTESSSGSIALHFPRTRANAETADELPGIAAELAEGLKDASDELREVSRGIHPTILTEAGLGPALRALARRSNIPIDVDVRLDERLPAPVEAAAYYIASEGLTNVAKHAQAKVVELIAVHDNGVLTLDVRDDGVGGVDAGRGSGILGLADRVEALGGTIAISSPAHAGTTLSVHLPRNMNSAARCPLLDCRPRART